MSETWHQVIKKDRKGKKGSGQHGDSIKSSSGPVALQQSNRAFSQWSTIEKSHEAKHASGDTGNEKHPHKSKKEKIIKMSIDEVAGEVDVAALVEHIENKKRENSGTPMVWLKYMTNYIQAQFCEVQVESDYSFLQEDPAYPATLLGSSVRSYIISLLRICPSLALENLYRDCIDCLLGEVKGGRPSYGTRMVIQLLRESRPELCSAANERIHLLLQSCGTKIPEILSLLWAGLPHPKSYPVVSLGAWDALCLPFLYEIQGVPKPVFIYCLKYTSLLLRSISPENRAELSRCLIPAKVASILSSPSIVIGRSHDVVQEILQLLKDYVLSDEGLLGYFSTCFIQLGYTEHKHLLMDFVVSCIYYSPSALSSWSHLAVSHIASSQLLLEYLDQNWTTVGGTVDSATLSTTLLHVFNVITVDEHRQLCQNLLTRLENEGRSKDSNKNQERNCSCHSVLCVVLTMTLTIAYMSALAMFLLHVATLGPESELKLLVSLKSPSDWSKLLGHSANIMWECVSCFLQFLELLS